MDYTITKEKITKVATTLLLFVSGTFISICISIGLGYIFTEFANIPYLISFAISFGIQLIYSFYYNTFVLYRSYFDIKRFIPYAGIVISSYQLNILIIWLGTGVFEMFYIYSALVSSVIATLYKYSLFSKFVFKKKLFR